MLDTFKWTALLSTHELQHSNKSLRFNSNARRYRNSRQSFVMSEHNLPSVAEFPNGYLDHLKHTHSKTFLHSPAGSTVSLQWKMNINDFSSASDCIFLCCCGEMCENGTIRIRGWKGNPTRKATQKSRPPNLFPFSICSPSHLRVPLPSPWWALCIASARANSRVCIKLHHFSHAICVISTCSRGNVRAVIMVLPRCYPVSKPYCSPVAMVTLYAISPFRFVANRFVSILQARM